MGSALFNNVLCINFRETLKFDFKLWFEINDSQQKVF